MMRKRKQYKSYLTVILSLSLFLFFTLESKEKIYNKLTDLGHYKYYMYGNSITAGSKWYPKLFILDVRNSATSGYTTTHMVWNLHKKVIQHKPKICFLMGGINDIKTGIPLSRTKRNYMCIIDSLVGNNIKPVIQSTLYVARQNHQANKIVDSLNTFLLEVAIDKSLDYINLNKLLSENGQLKSEFTFDGTHLNNTAYRVWIEELEKYLSIFEETE